MTKGKNPQTHATEDISLRLNALQHGNNRANNRSHNPTTDMTSCERKTAADDVMLWLFQHLGQIIPGQTHQTS